MSTRGRDPRLWTGALAGVVSVVSFAAIHYVLISNIWDMLGVMAFAGALSGLCLAWTYRRLATPSSAAGWMRYNVAYVGLFAIVPAVSVLLFDPVMTFAEASAAEGPLDDLIVEALPMTIVAVLVIATAVSVVFGTMRRDFGPILLTVVVLMVFLGLNLTIIGLVEFSEARLRVVAGFIGLILAIGLVFSATYLALERNRLRAGSVD